MESCIDMQGFEQASDKIPDNVTSLDQARPDSDKVRVVPDDKKKEQIRAQLIEAAVRSVLLRGIDGTTVNELASDVSATPGTFYACFPDLAALLQEVAALVTKPIGVHVALRSRARDPGARLAQVVRAHLRCAREDQVWAQLLARFASRSDFPVRAALLTGLEDDIIDGIGKGQFSAEPDEAALDLVLGTLVVGVLRVAEGQMSRDYDTNLTANILRGLGMVSAAALERVQRDI